MNRTIDANGGIHAGDTGRFTGHVQVEGDTAVLTPPADPFAAAITPPDHQPVEYGSFDVSDRFFAEVTTSRFEQSDEPVVEFYDKRYPMHGKPGQFISRYYVSTLREDHFDGAPARGLNLHGGVPEWTIQPEDYAPVLAELARRAPSYDGRTHAMNPAALNLMSDEERGQLQSDLADHPFGDDLTLADAIRTHGVMPPGGDTALEPGMVRFGDGRVAAVSKTTMLALSKHPALMRRMAG